MKNDCLNVWKAAAAFSVVLIHCRFPGDVGMAVKAAARFAVPFFFMISGYFSYGKGRETIRRRTIRTAKTLITASVVYLAWEFLEFSIGGCFAEKDLKIMFSMKALRSFLLFNQLPFMYHLWFLGSLLYCYLFYGILERTGKEEKLYFLIPLLIGASLFLGEGVEAMGGHTPVAFVRNFWLMGLPFFLWGHWFAARWKKREGERLLSPQLWILAVLAFAALSVAEKFLLGNAEIYLGSVLAAGAIFSMAIAIPDFGRGSLMAETGERDSQNIYLWHIIVYRVSAELACRAGLSGHKLYQWLLPLWVCLASWMLAEILERRKEHEQRHLG